MLNAATSAGAPVVFMLMEPGWLLPISTRREPALYALVIFSVNEQVPRRRMAISLAPK